MNLSRRVFITSSGAVAAGFLGLRDFFDTGGDATAVASSESDGYGALVPDPNKILDLPHCFRYSIISRMGDEMDDGLLVPDQPDGMATFSGSNGLTILIKNHEVTPVQPGPWGKNNERLCKVSIAKLYDSGENKTPGCAGTTTIVFDTKKQVVVRQFMSLAGTVRNCAGGPTPWKSWVTCEETVVRSGHQEADGYWTSKDHGFNFEVPASEQVGLVDPIPLKEMGRFNHEAIAVDPKSGIVFQTEDRDDGLIYRYIPKRRGNLEAGGTLQALKVVDHPSTDTRNWSAKPTVRVGEQLPVEWIDMEDVLSPKDDLRIRGFNSGAARFARGEGMWYGRDSIFFACTNGGSKKFGQIWRYFPSPDEGTLAEEKSPGRLELFVEPNNSKLVQAADNLTVSPWGDLIVCEDRTGKVIRMVGVTPKGKFYTFAKNHVNTEFAGSCFSPDGSTLFVNIQKKGLTVAITGPWKKSGT